MHCTAFTSRSAAGASCHPRPFCRSVRVQRVSLALSTKVRAAASSTGTEPEPSFQLLRRTALLGLAAAVIAPAALPSYADGEYKTFLGFATPPTSYGGYGGNANEPPKYTFEYPASWKEETPNKVEKGTQGIDGRVAGPRKSDQKAFVITLGRAGEDNKSFRLGDLDSTFAGFAGADYDLQDALSNAIEIDKNQREVGGSAFYDYDIQSSDFHYLSTITVQNGKVFALFVRSPTRTFNKSEDQLRHIVSSFKLL